MIESLAAVMLVALALAALAGTVRHVGTVRRTVRSRDAARVAALSTLEALRRVPRVPGEDVIDDPSGSMTRRWTVAPGRGHPNRLDVWVSREGRTITHLSTEVNP